MSASGAMQTRRAAGRGRWVAFGGAVVAVAAVALGVYSWERRGEWSPVARGERIAQASGCFACHGRGAGDQRANFRRLASGAWQPKTLPTFWEDGIDQTAVLVDWIANGVPADEVEKHRKLFIQMPAFQDRLAAEEIDAVAAWILAEGVRLGQSADEPARPAAGAKATAEQRLARGDRIARREGCYQCHGELGQGGVANAGAFKGYIAGFFGRDFGALTAGGERAEVLHWIEHGRGRAIEAGATGWLAKRFFARQAVGMPAYGEKLGAEEKELLADWIVWLNRTGPLAAKDVERVAKLLAP